MGSSDYLRPNMTMPQQFGASLSMEVPELPLGRADYLLNVVETLVSMNSTGVACWKDGNYEQALFLFEKGIAVCGIDIHHLEERSASTSSQAHSKNPSIQQQTSAPINHNTASIVKSVSVGCDCMKSSSAPSPIRDTAYLIFEKAIVMDKASLASLQSSIESDRQALLLIANHIAPMMLFNTGLLIHQQAVTAADYYWAHELYRTSLFLMEENTLHGLYSKPYDVLLLALFNNLCELNCSFYQNERVGKY